MVRLPAFARDDEIDAFRPACRPHASTRLFRVVERRITLLQSIGMKVRAVFVSKSLIRMQ
jgi:hypothetical protein